MTRAFLLVLAAATVSAEAQAVSALANEDLGRRRLETTARFPFLKYRFGRSLSRLPGGVPRHFWTER
jgi:hypothetical protein